MVTATEFLTSSILVMFSILVIVSGLVAINNLLHKYWKPVKLFTVDSFGLFGNSAADYYVDNHPEVVAKRTKEKQSEPKL